VRLSATFHMIYEIKEDIIIFPVNVLFLTGMSQQSQHAIVVNRSGMSSMVCSPTSESDPMFERCIDAFISYRRSTGSQLARFIYSHCSLLCSLLCYLFCSFSFFSFFSSIFCLLASLVSLPPPVWNVN